MNVVPQLLNWLSQRKPRGKKGSKEDAKEKECTEWTSKLCLLSHYHLLQLESIVACSGLPHNYF